MSELSVSLRIYCGSVGEGISREPVVSLGIAPSGYKPSAPSLVNENRSWVIVHAQRYTMYALCVKPMRTMNGDDGIVLINIFLPANQRFAREASPVHILTELFNTFTATGMHNGILPDSPIESGPFANVLLRYPLEDRVVTLPVMQGTKTASYCAASEMQLNAIMRHSRYQALTGVGQLELGMHCNSTIALMPKSVTTPGAKTVVKPKAAPKINNNAPIAPQPVVKHKSESHKFIRYAAIILGVVIAIPVVMLVLRSMSDSSVEDSDKTISEQQTDASLYDTPVYAPVQADTVSIASTDSPKDKYAGSTPAKPNQPKKDNSNTGVSSKNKPAVAEPQRPVQKQANKPEPVQKQSASAPASDAWQKKFKDLESKCPIQLRLGVRITSVSVASGSVVFKVRYEELSAYDMRPSYKDMLASDAKDIRAKYCSDLPSNVKCHIVSTDKSNRQLKY